MHPFKRLSGLTERLVHLLDRREIHDVRAVASSGLRRSHVILPRDIISEPETPNLLPPASIVWETILRQHSVNHNSSSAVFLLLLLAFTKFFLPPPTTTLVSTFLSPPPLAPRRTDPATSPIGTFVYSHHYLLAGGTNCYISALHTTLGIIRPEEGIRDFASSGDCIYPQHESFIDGSASRRAVRTLPLAGSLCCAFD